MKLNMQSGELGVIVKSSIGNEGKIVRCLSVADIGELIDSECGECELLIKEMGEHTTWHADNPIKWSDGYFYRAVKDSVLRPLRDSGDDDETLAWAGKPQEVTA